MASELELNLVARQIVDAAFHVHTRLGPGLFESVYEPVFAYELTRRKLSIQRQVPVPIVYDDLHFDEGFRADIIVNQSIVLELKSVESFAPVHNKQLLTYLRLLDLRLGLLINFGSPLIKDGIKRIVNRL